MRSTKLGVGMTQHGASIGSEIPAQCPTVQGRVNYVAAMSGRARYFANDHSRDNLQLDSRTITIADRRATRDQPALTREGFQLVAHRSQVANFRDPEQIASVHVAEIERLLLDLSGAHRVVVNPMGVLRFGESSPDAGKLNNSYPARFIHIDLSDPTAAQFAQRSQPKDVTGRVRRFAHYNVWRVLTPPPQDIPLAVCDARGIQEADRMVADAVFDTPGQPEWSFEGLVVHHNPEHRWSYFSNMTRDEALVFKTNDSDPSQPHDVPHTAFDDPSCPKPVPTRVSIEMRGIAYWLE